MAVNDSFNNLINDITQQVLQQVQTQVQTVITDLVNQKINDLVNGDDVKAIVVSRINENLSNYTPDLSLFEHNLQAVSVQIVDRLTTTADTKINDAIATRISAIDVDQNISDFITSRLNSLSGHFPFKENSIPGNAVDVNSLRITGDNIQGGIVQRFASTGIDDQSSQCQITVLDQGVVVENTVYAGQLEVKGGAVIDGDLTILGTIADSPAYQQLIQETSRDVQTHIGPNLLDQHQDRVFERIRDEGLDLNKVTFNGETVIQGDRLVNVIHSQLQTVGELRDLQTQGETLLSQTLYTNNRRVGINTMDPKNALSVWDEEIEIGIGKQTQGVARIGTVRDHKLILGSNNCDNITLTSDGVAAIPQLKIGNMLFSTSAMPPHYNAARGTVVFNEQPNLGGPIGWISLGDAKWANFGIID
jgi:hypothetical protein